MIVPEIFRQKLFDCKYPGTLNMQTCTSQFEENFPHFENSTFECNLLTV
jgi:hypothetical protein